MKGSKFKQRASELGFGAPQTLQELLDKAAPHLWKTRNHNAISYANIRDAIVILREPKLSDMTTAAIDEYTRVVSEDIRPSTVNRKLSSLHILLKYAYDREWLAKMPKFTWMKEDNERIRWLTEEEEIKLLAILPPEISAFCEILIHTGMRRDELRTMQRDQLNGDYARLWKTKNGKARSVPLSARARELMEQWVPFNLEVHTIRRAWVKAKIEMGLEHDSNFVLHTLRHTTATRMLESTGNIAVVQKMLGHSKIQTTMRYAHVSDEHLLDAVRLTTEKRQNVPVSA